MQIGGKPFSSISFLQMSMRHLSEQLITQPPKTISKICDVILITAVTLPLIVVEELLYQFLSLFYLSAAALITLRGKKTMHAHPHKHGRFPSSALICPTLTSHSYTVSAPATPEQTVRCQLFVKRMNTSSIRDQICRGCFQEQTRDSCVQVTLIDLDGVVRAYLLPVYIMQSYSCFCPSPFILSLKIR